MLTVGKDVSQVERRLLSGRLACPGCGGRLGPWGYARARVLRDGGEFCHPLRPRRGICVGCGVTHVLLPVSVLVRRVDVVEVIGAGLVLAAAGRGHRRIAERLGCPRGTVRGWVRRMRARAEEWRWGFTALMVDLAPCPVLPCAAGTPLGDALAAVVAAAVATAARWGVVGGLSAWEFAAAVTSGGLLSPAETRMSINTSCPW